MVTDVAPKVTSVTLNVTDVSKFKRTKICCHGHGHYTKSSVARVVTGVS